MLGPIKTMLASLGIAIVASTAGAADLYEDFESWAPRNSPASFTEKGWTATALMVRSPIFAFNSSGAVFFPSSGNPTLTTPLLTNGFGSISFNTTTRSQSAPFPFSVLVSTNSSGPWTTLVTYTNDAPAGEWTPRTFVTNEYRDVYLRIAGGNPGGGNQLNLGIDEIQIREAQAKADISDLQTDPSIIYANMEPHVFATIEPSTLATVTNVSVIYQAGIDIGTNAMSLQSGNLWRTVDPLPPRPYPITVNYTVEAIVEGTNAISPATASSSYLVLEVDLLTDYDINSMEIIGDYTAGMTLVGDYLWQGVVSIPSATGSGQFQFQGVHSDSEATHTWGDSSPDSTQLIVRGTAATNDASSITTGPLPAGQLAFRFNEQTGDYIINDGLFQDFETWTGAETLGSHEKDGWNLEQGSVFSDSRTRGRSLSLSTNATSALYSPQRQEGIGYISLWLRQGAEEVTTLSGLNVQVSEVGGTSNEDWVTAATISLDSSAWRREVVAFNNRAYTYVRLMPSDHAVEVLLDEVLIETPGAGVVLADLTHTPESPTATNSVSISVDLTTFREASIDTVTAWWRTGSEGSFDNSIVMQEGPAGHWTTTSDIPAGQGDAPDGLGAGDVDYYVSVDFGGYQSEAGTPVFSPARGAEGPATYTIQPARVIYSDVEHTPHRPPAGSTFEVSATITPVAAAEPPSPTLFYRTGTSGDFTALLMSTSGDNQYVTINPIAIPAHPGSPVQYYLRSFYQGPSAQSPTNYPAGGASDPITVLAGPPATASDFDAIDVSGDLNTSLSRTADYRWRGILSMPTSISQPSFQIEGTAETSVTWGDGNASGTNLPVYASASEGDPAITLAGTWQDDFIVIFNETNLNYSLRQVYLQTFSDFATSDTFTPGVAVTKNGWTLMNATVFNTNGAYDGNTLRLGGAEADGTNSFVQSPVIENGIGNIAFFYRNLAETGDQPGEISVQVRSAASPDWVEIDRITHILTADYLFHETLYVSNDDDIEVRIEWDSHDNPDLAWIAIDNVTIEHLYTYADVTNIEHFPTLPAITNNVILSADVVATYASNLTVTAWYRNGTEGDFAEAAMTPGSGNSWLTDPPLPRMGAGLVQYYLDVSFTTPHSDGPYTIQAPPAGAYGPIAYTNEDELAAFVNFTADEGWSLTGNTLSNQTNQNDWVLHRGLIKAKTFGPPSPLEAAWLNHVQDPFNHIRSPWLEHGVGSLMISNRMSGTGSGVFEILSSTNGTIWIPEMTITNDSNIWQEFIIPLNIEVPVQIEIRNTYSDSGLLFIGFDSISVSYPAAEVSISQVGFHPFYPSATDPVHITCKIESVSTFAPALGITARVYYRNAGSSIWSSPIEMVRNGDYFITSEPIPPRSSGTTVEYYVESTFKGYHRYYSYSPTLEPPLPNDDPYTYTTRTHQSNYELIDIHAGGVNTDMHRVGDYLWEGLLEFIQPTNQPPFYLQGYGFYDGTNVTPGFSLWWGDDTSARTNLPLSGRAIEGGASIVIPELAQGQYIIRFDERTRVYTVQRTAFQDFDTWPASDSLFEESYDAAEITTYPQDFDDWSLSSLAPMTDDFEDGWNDKESYPFFGPFPDTLEAVSPAGFYMLYDAAVVEQSVSSAAMLTDVPLSGQIVSTLSDSAGLYSFEARAAKPSSFIPVMNHHAPTSTHVLITANMSAGDLPINESDTSVGYAYKSIIANYIDENNYYEVRVSAFSGNRRRFEIWSHLNGNSVLRSRSGGIAGNIDQTANFSISIFRDTSNLRIRAYQGSTMRAQWNPNINTALAVTNTFGINGLDASLKLNGVQVHSLTNNTFDTSNVIYSDSFTEGTSDDWIDSSGHWFVEDQAFQRPSYTGDPLTVDVDYSHNLVSWKNLATFTNITHTDYRSYSVEPHIASNIYWRIRHRAGTGHLIVDNVRSEVWRGQSRTQDGWSAQSAWVTAGRSGNGLELRGSRALSGADQHIVSPEFESGVAIIAFDYLSVTGTDNDLVFAIDYAHVNSPGNWIDYLTVTNNPANWTSFSHSVDRELRPSIHQIRIRNASITSDPDAGILLDNIVITEPVPINEFTWWAYNTLVTDKQASRLAPIDGNIKGAYLNNGPLNGTGGINYTSYYPFVQSAKLPDGIGQVSFWYRAWDANHSQIEVVASTNRLASNAEWVVLDTLPVTSTAFQHYSKQYFEPQYRYVKLRVNTSGGPIGRVAIDDIRISAPFTSNLQMKNLELIPEIPLFFTDTFVRVDIHDLFFDPEIQSVRLFFKQGVNDWGDFTVAETRNMALVDATEDVLTYQTLEPIPARATDTVVQYQVEVMFDGFFAEYASPKRYTIFENPEHYWPIDLNEGQSINTPYYYTFSSLPGQVWINEFNITDANHWETFPEGQFIEIAGKGNTDIKGWELESILADGDYTTNAIYRFEAPHPTVIGTATNAYGFIVLAQPDVVGRDMDLTNALPYSGGLQLRRSMGAIEQQVAYDDVFSSQGANMLSPDNRYVYAGQDDDFLLQSFSLIESGSNVTDFVWGYTDFSMGTTNVGQTLIPWPDVSPDPGESFYTGTVGINQVWQNGARITFEVETQSENLTPVPWYTTNLMNITWHPMTMPSWTRTGTTYYVSGDLAPGASARFYTVTVTGTD